MVNKQNQPTRLLDMVLPWVEQAYSLHGYGERVTWEITFGIMQHPGGVTPLFTLFSQLPGTQLGAGPHLDLAQFHAIGVTEASCDEAVKEAMTRMLGARSQALQQQLVQGNGAPQGGVKSEGGIVLP